jgi:hypothetical protein
MRGEEMQNTRVVRRTIAAFAFVLASGTAADAQWAPPGPGWQPTTCQRTLLGVTVGALLDNGYEYSWLVNMRLTRYLSGNAAEYEVYPMSGQLSLFADAEGHNATWSNGWGTFSCWYRRVVTATSIIDDYVNTLVPPLQGNFSVQREEEQLCDEEGKYVDYGGEPCGTNTYEDPVGGGGDASGSDDGTNCGYDYIYIDVDYNDGRGWVTIWEGYARYCEG